MPANAVRSSPREAARSPARRSARSSTVSLVLVCPSTETQLNDCPRRRRRGSAGGRSGQTAGVGQQEGEHRRHPRADHRRPLGHAQQRERPAADRPACSETTLGRVSVVRIACDGRPEAARRRPRAGRAARSRPASSRSIGSWWPITPVEATRTCSGRQPRARSAASGGPCAAFASPCAPGGRVGVAGVDHDGADRRPTGRRVAVTSAPARRRPGWS